MGGTKRILISAEAEGVTGITNTNELLIGRPHYEFMRTMMTGDVHAAIQGAFAGGVAVVVTPNACLQRVPARGGDVGGGR